VVGIRVLRVCIRVQINRHDRKGGGGDRLAGQHLQREHQDGVGGDALTAPLVSVGGLGRAHDLPFGADRHDLHGFGPSGDDLVRSKRGGLTAGDRGVEGRAIGHVGAQAALVVARALLVGKRRLALVPALQDLVHYTRVNKDDSTLRHGVLLQVSASSLVCGSALDGGGRGESEARQHGRQELRPHSGGTGTS
jgi:hypothetical protein